jgi:hypothetical protein
VRLRGRSMHGLQDNERRAELAIRSEYSFRAGVFSCTEGHSSRNKRKVIRR